VKRDTVLVIDDDADFRELVGMLLEARGMRVLGAADCAEGLAQLDRERTRIGLILLDYWMPGTPPCECAARLRERAGDGVGIVLVTAAGDCAKRAAELRVPRWLAKPFSMSQLERLAEESFVDRG
jgi:DNA-binding response OmpR family regulator